MGDHRVSIKIEFEMHGYKKKWDAWLNWSDSIPQMAFDQVEEWGRAAMAKWAAEDAEYQEELAAEKRQKIEEAERAEYERLKAKFDAPRSS